jgi:hypothetical protein
MLTRGFDMHTHGGNDGTSMDQAIFNFGFSVETISVYLLCCGLEDAGKPITTKNLGEIWNGTEDELQKGLDTLEEKNILSKIISDQEDHSVYQLKDVRRWKRK